jgi:hypothetical protein
MFLIASPRPPPEPDSEATSNEKPSPGQGNGSHLARSDSQQQDSDGPRTSWPIACLLRPDIASDARLFNSFFLLRSKVQHCGTNILSFEVTVFCP